MRLIQVPYGRAMVNMPTGDLGPEHYKRYSMSMPLATHWRAASCAEVECPGYVNGFVLTADVATELGQKQAYFARHDRTRRCYEEKVGPTLIAFRYPPGNECFASDAKRSSHRAPIGRPPYYLVHDGDWRGNPRGTRPVHHRRVELWVEDFQENLDGFRGTKQRG